MRLRGSVRTETSGQPIRKEKKGKYIFVFFRFLPSVACQRLGELTDSHPESSWLLFHPVQP